jgi:enoyl-CoA hydratase/carnithine racemase
LSVREAKHAIRHGLHMELAPAMRVEIEAYNRLVGTEDRREGLRAFNEKRKPKFKGR